MSETSPAPAEKIKASRSWISEILITICLVLLALIVILPLTMPLYYVFKNRLQYSYDPWALPWALPKGPDFWTNVVKNYTDAWIAVRIDQGFWNTLQVCLGTIICTVPPAAMAGYVFARYRSKATEIAFYVILCGYFVPIMMVLIPLFRMSNNIGIGGTLPGLFLPLAAFGIPFWTIIFRSFFRGLPAELAEAARIDGAGHTATFFKVMFPLATPATVLATLLVFIGAWSDFLVSLVMINDQNLFTMQLKVGQFINQYATGNVPQYSAAVVISAAPTIILYIVFHRWILQGTLAGALKG